MALPGSEKESVVGISSYGEEVALRTIVGGFARQYVPASAHPPSTGRNYDSPLSQQGKQSLCVETVVTVVTAVYCWALGQ